MNRMYRPRYSSHMSSHHIIAVGTNTRTARSLTGARKALGALLNNTPVGTVGTIITAGQVVETGQADLLGWVQI